MAVKEKAPEPAPEQPVKKSKLKIIILFVVLLLLLAGGAASFWWFKLRAPGTPVAAGASAAAQAPAATGEHGAAPAASGGKPGAEPPRAQTSNVSLPTVTVNLSDAAGDRYLKVGMDVEVSAPEAVQEIQGQTAKIRDAIIILLSSKKYADLATAEGKLQLKNEVASRLNQILGSPRVIRIYFTEFVVQ